MGRVQEPDGITMHPVALRYQKSCTWNSSEKQRDGKQNGKIEQNLFLHL
jgi:hypothetical protein